MSNTPPPESLDDSLMQLAGYLNFSSGSNAPAIAALWNEAYHHASEGKPLTGTPAWLVLNNWLEQTLDRLSRETDAFSDVDQAREVSRLLLSELLPAYMDYHRDLLFHQEPEILFNGFFLARAAESVLRLFERFNPVGNKEAGAQLVQAAIAELNDFVGYRPVAMLENRRCHPYEHEFVRPIPLYVQGAGVSAGSYYELIDRTIEILQATAPDVLRAASFDFEQLKELSLDPRAYDFDHPVNRRPNYHFGGWDERSVGEDGFYNRFVLRQVTLDSLLKRVTDPNRIAGVSLCPDELMTEAAAVLAGTILMASGISGSGPAAYSSEITLSTLMKPIAEYRDAFYLDLLDRLTGEHRQRLDEEQRVRRQPFGAARQHLNAALAERRAAQVQHVQLARLYARMGYPDAAKRQIDVVPAASARMICRIDCDITLGLRALRSGDLDRAMEVPHRVYDLIQRAIHCGALADPWDLIGFAGQFSLHPSPDCSVHDSRVDDLLYLIDQLFSYMARVWSEAAARNDVAAYDSVSNLYREVASWWRQFGAHTITSLEATDPLESYDSARMVANALKVWHEGGAAAGDVAFWKPHADLFDSPRAYSLVISALLERRDFLPAQALLIHWLGAADQIGLRQGGNSLPRLAERWLMKLRNRHDEGETDSSPGADETNIWPQAKRFFDFLEANAESFWSAPTFHLSDNGSRPSDSPFDDLDPAIGGDDDEEDILGSVRDQIIFRGSNDDGNEGSVFDPTSNQGNSIEELELEWKRLVDRLTFLQSLSRMWSVAADIVMTDQAYKGDSLDEEARQRRAAEQLDALRGWATRAKENRIGLLELLDAVREYEVSSEGADRQSMRDYDRARVLRDSLMERIIGTAVEMSDARRLVCGAIIAHVGEHPSLARDVSVEQAAIDEAGLEEMPADDAQAVRLYAALISGDAETTRQLFPEYVDAISRENLLYIPLSRGGDPVKIYSARLRQRVLRHLMHWLPRCGLISEACRLIEISRLMEQQNSVGIGAVTEFDSLYRDGFKALVGSLAAAVQKGRPGGDLDDHEIGEVLIPLVERLTEIMLGSWLAHSQTLRLSPLETVNDKQNWERLVEFIRAYGDPIFTQVFLQLSNVRAILHQGVANYLERVIEEDDPQIADMRLFEDLRSGELPMKQAERWITLVYESLIDHHAEYQDYNSTTTQSDRGDLVYMFMDFLRLRASYERIAWNLKPVMWAHEVLVGAGLENAAILWRRSLSERIGAEAEKFVTRLRKLQKNYSMRMPTVADRIQERFVQPMTISRMRALVQPAMRDAEAGRESSRFELLEQQAEMLARTPTGAGLDVPAWLAALEEEVEALAKRNASSEIDPESLMTIPVQPLSIDDLDEQLEVAQSQGRRLPHMSGGKGGEKKKSDGKQDD